MTTDRPTAPRFLFLQGTPSPFFARLGAALARRGYAVWRIDFNAGDRLFWRRPGAIAYRGDLDGWPAFLEARLAAWRISDIILFGDCRPLHRAAIGVAAARGVTVHVAEEGYLRPNWITLAPGGVNGYSTLPRDPGWFRAQAALLRPARAPVPVTDLFWRRAMGQIAYHAACALGRRFFPCYRSHLTESPMRIAGGWARRLLRAPLMRPALPQVGRGERAFLFPLQLASDSQMRVHAPFRDPADALDYVCRSFARHAPATASLIVTAHPLDPGLTDWRRLTLATAAALGIVPRLRYGGAKPLRDCAGMVTVNSTAGIQALAAGVPVIALGTAIYDMPGLTFGDGIDQFWHAAAPPDPALFDAFRRVVADRTQVNGGFFSAAGIALAVAGAVERLECDPPRRKHSCFRPAGEIAL